MDKASQDTAAAHSVKRATVEVARVSNVVRKLAAAASTCLGRDCFMHATLSRSLLSEVGVDSRVVLGYAAWRVGCGDGDVLCHIPGVPSYGVNGAVYHAWLETEAWLIDLTTYQFQSKAHQLDLADGKVTTVTWTPDFLILERRQTKSLWHVQQVCNPVSPTMKLDPNSGRHYSLRPSSSPGSLRPRAS